MCGLAGILDRSGAAVELDLVRRMSDAIAHRGPDDQGQLVEGSVGLGNRRLAILDLRDTGHQPMQSGSGRLVITYNGELYNFRELRGELERMGSVSGPGPTPRWCSAAFEQWGEQCLDRFNGMFAFAIWDRSERGLFLARDRYGVKPLYYARGRPAPAVRIGDQGLLAHPAMRAELSPPHLLEYFTFQNIFTDGTLFKGVQLLPPGHCASIAARRGGRLEPRRYWDFDFAGTESGASDAEYKEELDRLFRTGREAPARRGRPGRRAAQRRDGLRRDHRAGGAVAAFPEHLHRRLRHDLERRPRGRRGRAGQGRGDVLRIPDRALRGGAQGRRHGALPARADLAPRGPAGRPELSELLRREAGEQVREGSAHRAAAETSSSADTPGATTEPSSTTTSATTWRSTTASGPGWSRTRLPRFFAPEIWSEVEGLRTIDIFRETFPDARAPEIARRSTSTIRSTSRRRRSSTACFVVEDKLSMAHSLENRVPFLDNDLVDFAQRLPVRLKLRDLGDGRALDENEPGAEDPAVLRAHPRREADPPPGPGALRSGRRSPTR